MQLFITMAVILPKGQLQLARSQVLLFLLEVKLFFMQHIRLSLALLLILMLTKLLFFTLMDQIVIKEKLLQEQSVALQLALEVKLYLIVVRRMTYRLHTMLAKTKTLYSIISENSRFSSRWITKEKGSSLSSLSRAFLSPPKTI